ncbi:hypothetical protein EDB86DRAFT_2831097 [Lactarius hatsudake]|nr:hypothetical protein EDB86DRAFT_2831097 [Lactarius hatsudake]
MPRPDPTRRRLAGCLCGTSRPCVTHARELPGVLGAKAEAALDACGRPHIQELMQRRELVQAAKYITITWTLAHEATILHHVTYLRVRYVRPFHCSLLHSPIMDTSTFYDSGVLGHLETVQDGVRQSQGRNSYFFVCTWPVGFKFFRMQTGQRDHEKPVSETLGLASERWVAIDTSDPVSEVIGDNTLCYPKESVLDSKWGQSKFLRGRESRRAARLANYAAEREFAKSIAGYNFTAQRPVSLSIPDAFPTPQMKNEWAMEVWHEACEKTGVIPNSFTPYELASPISTKAPTDSNIELFINAKKTITDAVDFFYDFDERRSPNIADRNKLLVHGLLFNMSFVFREHNPGESHRYPYEHPAIQKAINIMWFRNREDDGVMFHEHFSPMPIPAIAFILTLIECCIDEWADGKETRWKEVQFQTAYETHIKMLRHFQQLGVVQGVEFEHMRSDLIKDARMCLLTHDSPPAGTQVSRLISSPSQELYLDGYGSHTFKGTFPCNSGQDLEVPATNIAKD